MQNKLTELYREKCQLNDEQQQRVNHLIDERENSINEFMKEKKNFYEKFLLRDRFIQSEIENLKENPNEQRNLNKNIQLIHLSYQDKLNSIKNIFLQVKLLFIINIFNHFSSLETIKYQ